jgi:carboxypeptidase family protein
MRLLASSSRVGALCILALGLLFGAIPARAAELVGVVSRDSRPLAGAEVTLLSDADEPVTDGRVRSDAAGRFLIRNIRPGTYRLKCGERPPLRVLVGDGLNQINCNG